MKPATGLPASPWRPACDARPLRAWSRAQLQAVEAAYAGPARTWAADWGMAPPAVRAEPLDPGLGAGSWLAYGSGRAAGLWIRCESDERRASEIVLLGARATAVTDEILDACRIDLRHRWLAVSGMSDPCSDGAALPAWVTAGWSGAVQVSLGREVRLVASADAIRAVPGLPAVGPARAVRAERLHGIGEAMGGATVGFDLELDGCELPADSLLSLALGDVVGLSHRIEDPAHVRDTEGRCCFRGDLRRQGRRQAVELRDMAPAAEGLQEREESR